LKEVGRSLAPDVQVEMMRDAYKSLYRKYKARAWHLLTIQEMSDWGVIFSMQHHNVPTRLLDWTESFICALYFANFGRDSSDAAAIYLLSPEGLNAATVKHRGLIALGEDIGEANIDLAPYHPSCLTDSRPLHTIAVSPIFTNPRMVAQQSAFTLSGDSFVSLDESYCKFIMKIILPPSTYNDSRQFLDLVGVGHFSYFPDFQGLRAELISEMDREVETAKEE